MVNKYILTGFAILLAGCAAYKELEPEPPVSFREAGYIELKDDDERFELDEGSKYFIKFPRPTDDNMYLVLVLSNKSGLNSYLTRAFDDGEGSIIRIDDESSDPINLSLYPLDQTVPSFYWVIDRVSRDMVLNLEYRYVYIWRYKFENKQAEFEQVLITNTKSRENFSLLGTTKFAADIDYQSEKADLTQKNEQIKKIKSQLNEIEKIFPQNILNSSDASYLSYLAFRKKIDDELFFQERYSQFLDVFTILADAATPAAKLLSAVPELNDFFNSEEGFPANVKNEAQQLVNKQLPKVSPFIETELKAKTDTQPLAFDVKAIEELFGHGKADIPESFKGVAGFVTLFNTRSGELANAREKFESMQDEVNKSGPWPGNSFYTDARVETSRLRYTLPKSDKNSFGKYGSYRCATLLNNSVSRLKREINTLEKNYARAEELVPQINLLKNQGKYSQILKLLRPNRDLSFLLNQYAEIDQLSLTQQKMDITGSLGNKAWADAEIRLRRLHEDTDFLNPEKIKPQQQKLVRSYEDTLVKRIQVISESGARSFIEANKTKLDEIDAMYLNPALEPAHILAFTSGNRDDLAARNRKLTDTMNSLKHDYFPATSIELLYRSFVEDTYTNGVEKARAVVAHGKYYKGENKKLKNLVAECDPSASKWLTKPKQFRKLYILPLTTNKRGSNEYMFKINIQIPSQAKFPSYEINLKLPREITKESATQQWYQSMTFNGKPLKNEGRFTITAPIAENNYETQITPLQVKKTGNNVLEVKFKHNAFKVLEVTAMAQKPLIRKN